jgi:hypothetical protein
MILTDAANREAAGRLSARPEGAHPIGQYGVAYRDVGNEREQGRGSVAALGKDLSHCLRAAPCLDRMGGLCTRQYHRDKVLVECQKCPSTEFLNVRRRTLFSIPE